MSTHPLWLPFRTRANELRQAERVAQRQTPPGAPTDHDPSWSGQADAVQLVVREALEDRVLALHHVGSTAIVGMPAKPVLDLDLTVASVTAESEWLLDLERVGFRLIFRDRMAGDEHRQLTLADPNTNLHVWSPGAVEPQRHLAFTSWLKSHPDARDRYAAAKNVATTSATLGRYNDLKAPVVYDLLEEVFAADPEHAHDPRPRLG